MQNLITLLLAVLLAITCATASPSSLLPRSDSTEMTDSSPALEPYCLHDRVSGNHNEAMACLMFLMTRNDQWCEISGKSSSEFCSSGKTKITGVTETLGPVRARCREVAQAIAWVIDNCSKGQRVGGKKNVHSHCRRC
jgi:hypothetical protein